jgi:hypothetical protein
MGFVPPTARRLLQEAQRDDRVLLARVESRPAGMVIGALSAAAGFWVTRMETVQPVLLWLSLAGVMLGMLLHSYWKRTDIGWWVDFAARRIEPQGLAGETLNLQGDGWQVQVGPGDSRRVIAIDLRHADRGRVARLYESSARAMSDQRAFSELADVIAQRLDAERAGPRIV